VTQGPILACFPRPDPLLRVPTQSLLGDPGRRGPPDCPSSKKASPGTGAHPKRPEPRAGLLHSLRNMRIFHSFRGLPPPSPACHAASDAQRAKKARPRAFLRKEAARRRPDCAGASGDAACPILQPERRQSSNDGPESAARSCVGSRVTSRKHERQSSEIYSAPGEGPSNTGDRGEPQAEREGKGRWKGGLRRRAHRFKPVAEPDPNPRSSSLFSFLACLGSRPMVRGGRQAQRRGGPLACLGYTGPSSEAETWTPVAHVYKEQPFGPAPVAEIGHPGYLGHGFPVPAAKLRPVPHRGARPRDSECILDSAQLEWGPVRLIHSGAEGSSSLESTCGTSSSEEGSLEVAEHIDWQQLLMLSRLMGAVPHGLEEASEFDDLPPGLPSGPMYKPPAQQTAWQRHAGPAPTPATEVMSRACAQPAPATLPARGWPPAGSWWGDSPQKTPPSVRTAIMNVEERYQLEGLKARDRDREVCGAWQGTASPPVNVACWSTSPDWLQSTFRGGRGDGPTAPQGTPWATAGDWSASSAKRESSTFSAYKRWEAKPPGASAGPLYGWARETAFWETSPFESYNWCLPHQQVLGDVPEAACRDAFSRNASFSSVMNLAGAGSRTQTLSDEIHNVRRFSSQESAVSFNLWLP
jgi:hypothetical protein